MDVFIITKLAFLISIAAIFLVITVAIQVSKIAKRFPLLFYLRLTSWFLVLFFTTEIISIIFTNEIFAIVHFILVFPFTFFFILFYNNLLKESYYTIGFILSCCLGFLLIFLGTQPYAVRLVVEIEVGEYLPTGLFNIVYNMFYLLFATYLFSWGLKTWLNSPFYHKKKALLCFIGTIIFVVGSVLHLFSIFNPFLNIFMNLSNLISALIITMIIAKNIKILYVLPYTVYRISVRDNKGNPLYDHDWTEMNITETVFSGFLNAIEIMSEEVMHVGGILDIQLNEGILFVTRDEYITVGLLASKASKLLRDCVNNFTSDFENKFKRLLKKSCVDMNQYLPAYELINKYFSIIPYHNIKNRNQLITLSAQYHELPKQIENKFKAILSKEEYEEVLNECIKIPCANPSEFFDLYNELKLEIDELELKKSKEDKNILLE
ncbi:MAG: hypothetical protein ACFE9R_05690 [Candidatus Hermodarchaeota archaeon]